MSPQCDIYVRFMKIYVPFPSLELPGLRQLRGEHQGVEAALVDEDSSGFVGSLPNWEGALVFVVNVLLNGLRGFSYIEVANVIKN